MKPLPVPGAPATPHRMVRRPDHAILGGVAAGIADHLAVSARSVRVAFVVLTLSAGLGIALYGAFWIVLPTGGGKPRWPQWLEYVFGGVLIVGAIAVASQTTQSTTLLIPVLLASLGGALMWRQAEESERDRWLRMSRRSLLAGRRDVAGRARIVLGVVLVVSGAVLVLVRADVTAARDGLLAVLVSIIGLALITGPIWMRLMTELGSERSARIRSQERAEIAAHLHDSVLQTLALIQRNAHSPREVQRLARSQERELRTLLYEQTSTGTRLVDQLRRSGAEVEDDYAIAVEVIVVGDIELDEHVSAAADAAREALVNAAKHSGQDAVALYAEVDDDEVTIFVRDRGAGFDPEAIAADRQGLRNSIRGRVQRHGGQVHVLSAPGAGTEIEIRMPRR